MASKRMEMISVTTARELIREHTSSLDPVTLPLLAAAGLVVAGDIQAPQDIPAYPQSGMDGYAFSFEGWKNQEARLDLFGEIAAGRAEQLEVPPGKAVRIFTGAPVPAGTDTVVMQEKCGIEEGELIIHDDALKKGSNVRLAGSEIQKGALALEKGQLLTPAAIGFLANAGITEVSVYPAPVVSIIVTGNELQTPGDPLAYGQVYESNSISLRAALQAGKIPVREVYRVEDQLDALTRVLGHALENSDLVVITGGISVGDYDFTLKAAITCGVQQVFHKVRQKPGKPLYFGHKGKKLVFGLPGNPSSVLTCYYEYVLEAIGLLMNRSLHLQRIHCRISNEYTKPAGITHFLKGHFDGNSVLALGGQESYKLHSFARANCLIVVPEPVTRVPELDEVEVHLLPS